MLKYPPMDPFELNRLGIKRGETAAKFRKQVWLQVYLPLALGLVLLTTLIVVLWRGPVGDASVWADTALAFLMLPVMLVGLLLLALFGALVVGVTLAVRRLPEPFEQARLAVARVEDTADQVAGKAALPVIIPSAIFHTIGAVLRYLAGIFDRLR